MTYSRRRTSSGRKSRMPRAGWVWAAVIGALCVLIHVLEPVAHVVGRTFENERQLGVGERAPDLAGTAHHERPRRNDGAFRDQGPCSHDRIAANVRAVQQDGAHADQAPILHDTAVEDSGVANRHALADNRRVRRLMIDVNDDAVLQVRLRADADVVHVAAHYGVEPDAAFRPKDNIADHLRGLVDVRRRVDRGDDVAEGAEHCRAPQIFGSVTPRCAWYFPLLSLYEISQGSSLWKNSTCAMPSRAYILAGSGVVLEISIVTCPSHSGSKGVTFTMMPHRA